MDYFCLDYFPGYLKEPGKKANEIAAVFENHQKMSHLNFLFFLMFKNETFWLFSVLCLDSSGRSSTAAAAVAQFVLLEMQIQVYESSSM